MQWVQANWMALLTAWAAIGVVLDSLGNAMPQGRWKATVLAIAHVSPMTVVSAVKAARGALQ